MSEVNLIKGYICATGERQGKSMRKDWNLLEKAKKLEKPGTWIEGAPETVHCMQKVFSTTHRWD